jgi:7,8-dihydropterin-6-yl-methyl-4-(beta-D-ribofuranosyl)aminobenzene 5'-phosphate synthase
MTTPERQGEAMPRIPLEPVDAVALTILVENVYDIFMPNHGPAARSGPGQTTGRMDSSIMVNHLVPDQLVAEHGFSVLVDVSRRGQTHRILFDLGVSPTGMVDNMRRLDIDSKDVEAVVCSHGHYDHTAGLEGLAGQLGRANLPVIIHPEFWSRRRIVFPGRDPFELPTTSRGALEGVGFTIIEEAQPSFLLDGSVLITGEVPRVTEYEPGFPIQQAWRNDHWEPDPLVLDDQAMVINLRDQGLVIITGCGHAGVVNITRYARLLTGERRVCAIVGGFHLNGPIYEPLIDRVCADLHEMQPSWIVPGHCTGWRAQHHMSKFFGQSFVPSCAGTRLQLGTAAA